MIELVERGESLEAGGDFPVPADHERPLRAREPPRKNGRRDAGPIQVSLDLVRIVVEVDVDEVGPPPVLILELLEHLDLGAADGVDTEGGAGHHDHGGHAGVGGVGDRRPVEIGVPEGAGSELAYVVDVGEGLVLAQHGRRPDVGSLGLLGDLEGQLRGPAFPAPVQHGDVDLPSARRIEGEPSRIAPPGPVRPGPEHGQRCFLPLPLYAALRQVVGTPRSRTARGSGSAGTGGQRPSCGCRLRHPAYPG